MAGSVVQLLELLAHFFQACQEAVPALGVNKGIGARIIQHEFPLAQGVVLWWMVAQGDIYPFRPKLWMVLPNSSHLVWGR